MKCHPNLKSFKKAFQASRDARGIPNSATYHGSGMHSYEYAENGVAHCRVAGRELLGELGGSSLSAATVFGVGERLPAGMFPIAPSYVGGQLELMAQQYEQHTVHRMVVRYEPVVPATETGAIAMYFTNDVGTPTIFIGESELGHAATHDSFIQTTIWNEADLNINPSDAVLRYFDEDHNESRLSVQGIVFVLAADAITLDPAGTAGPPSLGNLYLEYEVEFFAAALANDVPMRSRAVMTMTSGAAPSVVSGDPITVSDAAATATVPNFVFDNYPPGLGAGDLVGWAFYGVVTNPMASSAAPNTVPFTTNDATEASYFQVGQGFWVDFITKYVAGVGQVVGSIFTDLNGMEESYDSAAPGGSLLLWASGAAKDPAAADAMKFDGYFVKKTEDSS